MPVSENEAAWRRVNEVIGKIAREHREWAGMPRPAEGLSMTVHPSYPYASRFEKVYDPDGDARFEATPLIRAEGVKVRNFWTSRTDGSLVAVLEKDGKISARWFPPSPMASFADRMITTIGAARAWDFDAEMQAMETLTEHLDEWPLQCYFMTGSFLESSPRSKVMYLFRRLRPTLAFSMQGDRCRLLCGLCMHPIGYYNNTFAGAMVPTDDVIAHLLLMRSDEHLFWKQSNQHSALELLSIL